MSNLLKDIYDKAEDIRGKKLLYTLIATFFVFVIIGVSIGYLISPKLSEDENVDSTGNYSGEIKKPEKMEIEGRVTYVNPDFYPEDDISFSLTDSSGKEIYLLKAKDQKLKIAEGLFVKVVGKVGKLKDEKTDVFIVEEVIIKSATD